MSCSHMLQAYRLVCWLCQPQARSRKKLGMADGTAVTRAQPSIGTHLPRGTNLLKLPVSAQAFCSNGDSLAW